MFIYLDEELLDLILEAIDLRVKLRTLGGKDGAGNNRPGDTAGTAKSDLGGDKDVRDILVFAEEGEVEEDLKRLGVSGHDDELADATVEGLGGLVGALAELLVVAGLLDEVEDLLGGGGVSKRDCLGVCLLVFAGHFFVVVVSFFSFKLWITRMAFTKKKKNYYYY